MKLLSMKYLLNKKTIFKLIVAGKIMITLGVLSAGVINKHNPDNFRDLLQNWKQPTIEQNSSQNLLKYNNKKLN